MAREIKFRAWELNPRYEIGTDGSVYSLDFNHSGKRKALKQYTDKDGYKHVYLYDLEGKRHIRNVHRIVLKAFVPKPTPKHQVNHKNGIRTDNRLENLEWLTSRENTIHGWKRGRVVSAAQRKVMSRVALEVNRRRWHPEQYAKAA